MDSEFWQDAEHRVQRAKDLLRHRRLPEALEELRAAAELDPLNAVHHYELGHCLELLGRDDEAADAYGRAIETDPRPVHYWSAYGEVLLALGRWREAADAFSAVEQLSPDNEACYANRVWTYTELGDHDRAEQMFYLAQQVRDDRPLAFYHVGRSLYTRGDSAKAQWCWQHTIDLCGSGAASLRRRGELIRPHHEPAWLATQSMLRTAECMADEGRLEESRRHYLQALARDGRQPDALLGLAELLLRMRRFDAAAERITRAVRLDPDHPRGHFVAGRRYLALGKLNEAYVALKRVVELDADFPRAHLLLARIAARQDEPVEVRRQCRLEMMRRPDEPETLTELGGLLLDVGDYDRAVACFKRLVALAPADSQAWQNLGVAQCWRGELMQGVVASRRALKLDSTNMAAANNLALAFLDMRELDAAAKVIADGLEVEPSNHLLRRLRLRLKLLRLADRARRTLHRLLGRDTE